MDNRLIDEGVKQLCNHMPEKEAIDLANYLYKYIDKDTYQEGINKLIQGLPIQYIIGNVNFYGNIIKVTPDVLIPRFETEELIEKTIKYIDKYFNCPLNIVDLGTGSGCIGITLKKIYPHSNITAVDISSPALEIAKINARDNGVKIDYLLGDLYQSLNQKYDIIISNPPYLSESDDVQTIVKNNEPKIALYASNDGLEVIEQIIKEAPKYLKDEGMIALEIGENQGKQVKLLAKKYFDGAEITIEQDLQERTRFAFILINHKKNYK
ncbi:MAG: peptide chain release factor N(5)-glutamine methyltransferase [Bacilli bacterium]|nr:peptide chain release factor N(5)-glutamine methyltransferase [Bacilli bacterium]MDD4808941.1 peptide chain release factor N(5)-glutamine methyltransferase [Bacilli bacterium]